MVSESIVSQEVVMSLHLNALKKTQKQFNDCIQDVEASVK